MSLMDKAFRKEKAMQQLPLEGVRVLDLTVVWAGPYATTQLGDWGAEVIRVESLQVFPPSTRGQMIRPPAASITNRGLISAYPDNDPGLRPWNRTALFNSHARNKKSMTLDLRRPEGKQVLYRLLALSDVFIENNVPETIEKLGLAYEELVRVKPDLIMVRMPAYGLTGPYKNYRSFGAQLEGTVGHNWVRGYRDSDPTQRGDVYTADGAAGVLAAFATVMALRYRSRTGKGQLVEFPQAEAFIPYLGEIVMDYSMNQRIQGTLGNRHPFRAPQGCYPCRGQDRWVTLSVGSDEEWQGLLRAMGNPSWGQEPRFVGALGRWRYQDELDALIAEWTRDKEPYEVFAVAQREGVPSGPVYDERDAFADPHLKERGYFQSLTQEDCGTHLYPGPIWRTSEEPTQHRLPPVRLGEHNPYVYRELLGFSGDEYRRWEAQGHIGMDYAPEAG